jgi:hypothetical protein
VGNLLQNLKVKNVLKRMCILACHNITSDHMNLPKPAKQAMIITMFEGH